MIRFVTIVLSLFMLTTLVSTQEFVRLMEQQESNVYETRRAFEQYWQGRQIEKGKGWKQFQRWYHFWEPRVFPQGLMPPANQTQQAMQQYRQAFRKNSALPAYISDWKPLGPFFWVAGSYSPGQGRVNGMTVDPMDPNVIYAGTPAGGLWISNDGGNTWTTTTDSLEALGVTSIVVDPFNSNTIYIASGDGDAADTYSLGVLKSTDGGQSWQQTGLNWDILQSRRISKLLSHPNNSDILLAATGSGIYRTADAGQSWTLTLSGNYKDMEFHPTDPNIVYIAGTSFFRSVNNGQSFQPVASGLPLVSAVNRLAIAVSKNDPNIVYVLAGASGSSGFQGFYASTDAGLNFTQRSNSPNLLGWQLDGSDSGGQSWYDLAIAASPVNANEVFVGGVNIWRTTDGGFSWNINTHWVYPPSAAEYVHADIHSLDFYGNTLYAGCDGGLFKTDDFGANWIDLSAGIVNTQFYRMGGYPGDPGLVLAGAQDNGSMRLADSVWTQVFGADGMEAAIDYSNPDNMYVCYQFGGLLKSTDGGDSFFDIAPSSGAWITPYLLDPSDPQRLYAGYNPLYVSDNGGLNWSQVTIPGLSGNIAHIAISPADPEVLYVGRSNQLFRSVDYGANWQNISSGLPFTQAAMTYFYTSPLNPDHIWATFSGYVPGIKVYRSIDGGANWENYSGSLPNLPANCVTVQGNLEEGVYVGTDVGIYYRNHHMADWMPFFDGLPNVIVDELEIHEASGMLRAATYGRGLWESPLAASGPFIGHTPLADTEDAIGPYTIEAQVTPGSSAVGSSIFVHYGYDGVIDDSIAMTVVSGDLYSGAIPGPGSNALVTYFISAADQNGFRNTLPTVAPVQYFSFSVGPDTIAPQTSHQQLTVINQLMPWASIEVVATDERGIDTVFVEFSINQGAVNSFSLSGSDSLFSGQFPLTVGDLQIADSILYSIFVRDGALANNQTVIGPIVVDVRRIRQYLQQQIIDIPDNDPSGVTISIPVNDDGDYFIRNMEVLFKAEHGLIGDLSLNITAPDGRTLVLMDRPGFPAAPFGNLANDPDIRLSDSAAVSIEDIAFGTNEVVKGVFRPSPELLSAFLGLTPLGEWKIAVVDHRAGFLGKVELVGIDFDLTNVVSIDDPGQTGTPATFALMQNYPNPFNPVTTIEFRLPSTAVVTLEIFDNIGRRVVGAYRNIPLPAGTHRFTWDGTDAAGNPVASGVYYYRMKTKSFNQTRKMLLVR